MELVQDEGPLNIGRGQASDGNGRGRHGPPPPVGWFIAVFGERQTWKNLLYLGLAFPLGLAYFIFLVTLLSTGAGLAITLVGLPVLALAMFAWGAIDEFERWLTNRLLGTAVRPFPKEGERGVRWLPRVRARLRNPMTWRSLGFLMLRFPVGTALFTILNVLVVLPLFLISAPIVGWSTGGDVELVWRVDTWQEGLPLALGGLLFLPLGVRLLNRSAAAAAKLAEACLGRADNLAAPEPVSPRLDRIFAWQGFVSRQERTDEARHLSGVQLRVLRWHASVVLVVDLFFLLVNIATPSDLWWSLWVMWALSFALSLHAGYVAYGWLGAHVGFSLAMNLGFLVIDLIYSSNLWFFWMALSWAPFLLLHAVLDRRARGRPMADLLATKGSDSDTSELRTTDAPGPATAGISVDIALRRVLVDGAVVELTPKEFDLLALFFQNPLRPFSRDELLDRIWRNDYEITDRTVDTHVQRLRKKLGPHSDLVQTVWGVGYRYSG